MAYTPPSVIINKSSTANGSTTFVQPSTMAIVAKLLDYPSTSTTRTLSNGSVVEINVKNFIADNLKLTSMDGSVLVKGTDYSVAQDDANSKFSITILNSNIKTQPISITYAWLPDNFFTPLRWFSKASVESFYGPAFTSAGAVNSTASAAAQFAFDNGATSVCIIPVYAGTGSNPSNTLTNAIESLKLQTDVTLVVPANLTEDELYTLGSHIKWANENALERRGIFALDGTATPYTVESLMNIMQKFDDQNIMFIPNNIGAMIPSDNTTSVNIPGWLFAAAVCGLAMSIEVWQTLTRKNVYGFSGLQDFLYEEKNTLAAAGGCVIEKANSSLRIRHSLVTSQSGLVEWTFGGVYQHIVRDLRTALDVYVGQPSTDVVLAEIQSKVSMYLTQQVDQSIIKAYKDVSVQLRSGSPGVIDVTFSYTWLSAINWIYVNFSVDTD